MWARVVGRNLKAGQSWFLSLKLRYEVGQPFPLVNIGHSAAQGVPVAGHGHNRQNIFFQIEIEWVFDYRMNKFEAFLMLINHH